jgi:UDP:flavonoid glycosyltransferase YjiC (YdhE family)
MSFFQRLLNTVGYVAEQGMNYLYMFPQQDKLVKKYFPNGPSLYDVIYNASILLVNSHPSIDQPVPRVPSMIDVGGLHVKPPKPLPKDLQELLDGAEEGVVYFSLGSYLKSTFLPEEKRQIFVKAFSKLKQTVLWKWEEDSLPGQPANVHLAKWLRQQDILGNNHKKKFFDEFNDILRPQESTANVDFAH